MAEKDSFSLTSFFTDHSHLFVVISVFSGLLVFFTGLLVEDPNRVLIPIGASNINPLEYSTVACYLIVITVAFLLLYHLFSEDDKLFPIDYMTSLDTIKRIWLVVPLLTLILGGGAYVIKLYPSVLWSFAFVFASFLGFVAYGISLTIWTKYIEKFTKWNGRSFQSLLGFSIVMLAILVFSQAISELFQQSVGYLEVYLAFKLFLGVVGSGVGISLIISLTGCFYIGLTFFFQKTLGLFGRK